MTEDVLTRIEGGLGHITLNRPAALHALTEAMCLKMIDALTAWAGDATVKIVLIDHAAGTRGFCAGGDIRFLADDAKAGGDGARAFFFNEYRLNHLLHEYQKPVVALVDGVVMGGGVGISAPARYRVVTERTTYAMPETGIGLFPDVGGGWFLSRMQDEMGVWLALTGARIKAADCIETGISTHYAPSDHLDALRAAISAAASAANTEEALRTALEKADSDPGAPKELAPDNRARIAKLFAHDSVEQIVAALKADASEWAQAQLAVLATKSPQTMKVALRQLRAGAKLSSFADNMKMEYRIAARVIHKHDFSEGVRAVIVDKDNAPRWNPETLEAVTPALLDEIFAPLPADKEWSPLPQGETT